MTEERKDYLDKILEKRRGQKEKILNELYIKADRVKLLLREHPAFYQILIQDNGKCVHPGDGTGIGITNMRQRVETFGGTIDIRTENGYRIFIHIPKADIPAGR